MLNEIHRSETFRFDSTMRKASISIISRFTRRRSHSFAPLLSSNYTSAPSSPSSSTLDSQSNLNLCTKFNVKSSKSHQFQGNPSRNFKTHVNRINQSSPEPPEPDEKSKLEEAFKSAQTAEEKIRALTNMESWVDERELGMASLQIGLKLEEEGKDPEKILDFANKALKFLDSDDKYSLFVAVTLRLMGSANYSLKRFSDSLEYLNRASELISRLEEEGLNSDSDLATLWPVFHSVQLLLAEVKTAMGKREEAIVNFMKCWEIKRKTVDKGSVEFGVANRDLAEAYTAVLNFKKALPFCLKSLEINLSHLGHDSVEVGNDRRLLGMIYSGLEEHEKALHQIELYQRVLKKQDRISELLRTEVEASNMRIALGRYDEAIDALKAVVNRIGSDSETRALVFISMAKALCCQEKFSDSKRCLEIASGILDKKEKISPTVVIEAYTEMSMQYESMNEFETAISMLERILALLEKVPQEENLRGSVSARIGWLLLLTGKAQQAVPYLESAANILTHSFGPKHYGVGYIFQNLGTAYLELGRLQSAVEMFHAAKEIMDVIFGSTDANSVEACQNLSKAYEGMGSYALAIEFQHKVIDALERNGSNEDDELREAHRLLQQLQKKEAHS